MQIGRVDLSSRVCVIAEIGGNHDGDFGAARELVAAAAGAGADAVKFQVYRGERLVQKDAPTMPHVRHLHRTQRERFKSLEFTEAQWHQLAADATQAGIDFLASVFDPASADALSDLVPAYKIASGDLTNLPLLRHVAASEKPIILSTGMASLDEIERALAAVGRTNVVLLHCVSIYPTPPAQANLRAILRLRECFGVPVGYSDHTRGSTACLAAAALGAVVIEKHFTLDTSKSYGDHRLSADPGEMARIVAATREIEQELGSGDKVPSAAEAEMRVAMRRGLYTSRDVAAGVTLSPDDVVCLRPATGLTPAALHRIIGRKTKRALAAEEPLREEDFESA